MCHLFFWQVGLGRVRIPLGSRIYSLMLFYLLRTALFAVAFARVPETRLENPKLPKQHEDAPTAVLGSIAVSRRLDDATNATFPPTPFAVRNDDDAPVFVDDDGNVTHTCDEFQCTLLRRAWPRDVEIRDASCCGLPETSACRSGYRFSQGDSCGRGQSECKLHKVCCTKCSRAEIEQGTCERKDRRFGKAYDCTRGFAEESIFFLVACCLLCIFPCCCFYYYKTRHPQAAAERRPRRDSLAESSPTELADVTVIDVADGTATPPTVSAKRLDTAAVATPRSDPEYEAAAFLEPVAYAAPASVEMQRLGFPEDSVVVSRETGAPPPPPAVGL